MVFFRSVWSDAMSVVSNGERSESPSRRRRGVSDERDRVVVDRLLFEDEGSWLLLVVLLVLLVLLL